MKETKKKEKKEINSRVNLLNKRDQIDEYIFNSVATCNEYLLSKNKKNFMDNLNSLTKDRNDFLAQTKIYLKKIDDMKNKIFARKNDFIVAIKNHAENFVNKEKILTEKSISKIEKNHMTEVKNINSEIEKIETEKINLYNTKVMNVEKVKSKISQIQKEANNAEKFDLDSENQEIINLTSSHKKFITNEIKVKINDLNSNLEKLNKNLTNNNEKKVKDIYKKTMDSKIKIKNEFLFLFDIEKATLKKMTKFKDFLDDVEYFANDKTEKYKILLSNAKAIKAENFKNLMYDTNKLISFVSNSESIFDNANFLINNIKKKIQDPSVTNKLEEFKKSLLNSNSIKLLKNKNEEKKL